MSKRLIGLAVAVLLTAVAAVDLRHRNRVMFAELQSLKAERDALNIEWGRLLLEEGTWAQHRRIEATARTRLGMALPRPDQVIAVQAGDR